MRTIYFCGTIIPDNIYEKHFEKLKRCVTPAGNVFYNALLNGFVDNGIKVVISTFLPESVIKNIKLENNCKFVTFYEKRSSNQILRNIKEFFCVLKRIKHCKRREKDCCVVFNVLRLSQSVAGIIACKIYGVESVAVVTDVPGYRISSDSNAKIISKVCDFIGKKVVTKFRKYILISEQMNEILNINDENYVVLEGLFNAKLLLSNNYKKEDMFIIMYAGSLEYKYGIMNLISAVRELDENVKLCIYGAGEAADEITDICKAVENIEYLGVVSHDTILKREMEVSLLVNPRPVEDIYVKYSFPSKNMEYMASGTPTLLTKIPSLPIEYYPYVYLANTNSIQDLKKGILEVYYEGIEKRELKAQKAQEFILKNKNPKTQINEILNKFGWN